MLKNERIFFVYSSVCPENKFKCGTGECIDKSLRCDEQARKHCLDGSDEADCCLPALRTGKKPGKICDKVHDCPDGEDELPELCGVPEGRFRCCE